MVGFELELVIAKSGLSTLKSCSGEILVPGFPTQKSVAPPFRVQARHWKDGD